MHCSAFTPIEGMWFSQNLPFSTGIRRGSASADEMQFVGCVELFERCDPLVITRDQPVMRCPNLGVERQIFGGLLFGPPAAIIFEVLVHDRDPHSQSRREAPATRLRELST